jgi:hypothetical protein
VLRPVWRVATAPTTVFPGAIDTSSNTYWVECPDACELVSVTRDGLARFRAPLLSRASAYGSLATLGDFLITDTAVVIAPPGGQPLEAYERRSGRRLWTHDIVRELLPQYPSCTLVTSARQWSLSSDGAGQLAVFVLMPAGCSARDVDVWALGLSAATGATQWTRRFGVSGTQLQSGRNIESVQAAFDESGTLYALFRWPTLEDQVLMAFGAGGATRWQRTFTSGAYALGGLAAGRLLLPGSRNQPTLELETQAGGTSWQSSPVNTTQSALVTSRTGLVLSTTNTTELVRFDFASRTRKIGRAHV